MTHASRDTTTGAEFEKKVHIDTCGVDVSKHKLYKYLEQHGIRWQDIISKKLLPDEAYYDEEEKELKIYEKKFQQTAGSADEKPQTCGFKIHQFRKLGEAMGAEYVTYTYLLSPWFAKPEYKDMLSYIRNVDGCDYMIIDD